MRVTLIQQLQHEAKRNLKRHRMARLRHVVFEVRDGSIERHLGPQNNERVMLKPAVTGSVIAALYNCSTLHEEAPSAQCCI
jgi:hypothetical protein